MRLGLLYGNSKKPKKCIVVYKYYGVGHEHILFSV